MTIEAIPNLRITLLKSVSGGASVFLVGALMGFLVGIQLARGLGVDGYGIYGSALAVANLGAATASGGVNLLAARDTAAFLAKSDRASVRRLLLWSLRHVLIFTIPVSVLAVLALWCFVGVTVSTAVAGGVLVCFLALIGVFGGFLRGVNSITFGMALDAAVRPAAYSAMLFILALCSVSLTPTAALVLTGVAITIALLIGSPRIVALLRAPSGPVANDVADRWYRSTMTMRISAIMRIAEASLPVLIIGALVSMSEAGGFRVAASITALGGMVSSVVRLALPPLFARLHALGDTARIQKLASASSAIMTFPALALLALSLVFGEWAIGVVFGQEFVQAAVPTSILLGSTVIVSISGLSTVLLYTYEHEKPVNSAFGLSLVLTTLLSLALAPRYGAVGVAVAVALGVVVRSIVTSVMCYRKTGIDPTIMGLVSALGTASKN